jgi:hypothetical protein
MEQRRTLLEEKENGMKIKLCKLALLFAVLLSLAPFLSLDQASASSPCDGLPGLCKPTYDPVTNCCISDPRFDCVDICF